MCLSHSLRLDLSSILTLHLLVAAGVPCSSFRSMGEFDRFAARLLLVGLLTNRRVVMPPIPCGLPWMQRALEPRHLRGMEVGCGDDRQCIWLPYPHHIDALCAGVDYLNDIDYRDLMATAEATPAATASFAAVRINRNGSADGGTDDARRALGTAYPSGGAIVTFGAATRGSLWQASGEPSHAALTAPVLKLVAAHGATGDPLESSIPLGGFKSNQWIAPLPRRVEAALRAPPPVGMSASDGQMKIVRDCLRSLARSNE